MGSEDAPIRITMTAEEVQGLVSIYNNRVEDPSAEIQHKKLWKDNQRLLNRIVTKIQIMNLKRSLD